VVHPERVRAFLCGNYAGRNGPAEPFAGWRRVDGGDERLASRADEDRRFQAPELLQSPQEFERMPGILGEAEARIEEDSFSGLALSDRALTRVGPLSSHVDDHVCVRLVRPLAEAGHAAHG